MGGYGGAWGDLKGGDMGGIWGDMGGTWGVWGDNGVTMGGTWGGYGEGME